MTWRARSKMSTSGALEKAIASPARAERKRVMALDMTQSACWNRWLQCWGQPNPTMRVEVILGRGHAAEPLACHSRIEPRWRWRRCQWSWLKLQGGKRQLALVPRPNQSRRCLFGISEGPEEFAGLLTVPDCGTSNGSFHVSAPTLLPAASLSPNTNTSILRIANLNRSNNCTFSWPPRLVDHVPTWLSLGACASPMASPSTPYHVCQHIAVVGSSSSRVSDLLVTINNQHPGPHHARRHGGCPVVEQSAPIVGIIACGAKISKAKAAQIGTTGGRSRPGPHSEHLQPKSGSFTPRGCMPTPKSSL